MNNNIEKELYTERLVAIFKVCMKTVLIIGAALTFLTLIILGNENFQTTYSAFGITITSFDDSFASVILIFTLLIAQWALIGIVISTLVTLLYAIALHLEKNSEKLDIIVSTLRNTSSEKTASNSQPAKIDSDSMPSGTSVFTEEPQPVENKPVLNKDEPIKCEIVDDDYILCPNCGQRQRKNRTICFRCEQKFEQN